MPHDQFDIDGLATYLHLTHAQIARLVDRGKLPGRKVAGKWRFSRAEIHHWMERRMGVLGKDELTRVEGVLKRRAEQAGDRPLSIARLLPPTAVAVPLAAKTRVSAIGAMVELAARTELLWDPAKMVRAVRTREDMQPTALDNGVALLHPRRPMPDILAEALIALGRTYQGIPFGGSGRTLTDVFFLICSTDDRGHLRALARIARLISGGDFLAELRRAPDAATTHRLILDREKELFP